jgi:carbon-monoxide dehydrogenase small subunit
VPEVRKVAVSFTVNGEPRTVESYPMARLLDLLRQELRLTGTKEGCGEGECGACSVLINGELVNSCLVPVAQVEGSAITTIEGISGETLHAVQEAFVECGGSQCGICTPGMVLAAVTLLARQSAQPTEDDIRNGLAGNLCRCTGYMRIFKAVLEACEKSVGARA